MGRKIVAILSVLVVILVVRLFFGVYADDEFGGSNLFVKHRPVWKWKFYSPIGMSDRKLEELSEEQKEEQVYFDEFVAKKRLSGQNVLSRSNLKMTASYMEMTFQVEEDFKTVTASKNGKIIWRKNIVTACGKATSDTNIESIKIHKGYLHVFYPKVEAWVAPEDGEIFICGVN